MEGVFSGLEQFSIGCRKPKTNIITLPITKDMNNPVNQSKLEVKGPLHDPVTWYKITNTGKQIAQRDFQNNAAAFVLEVPLCNLLTSICKFVPCDQVVQRAYNM